MQARLDRTVSRDFDDGRILDDLRYNAVINRDGIQGLWSEHDVLFPASALREGANTLKLTIPGGNPTSGIEYDYLRLELAPDHEPAKRS